MWVCGGKCGEPLDETFAVIAGESTVPEVSEALEGLKAYPWPVRLDGHSHPGTWVLRWAGVSPETRDNGDSITIIRTRSWERYCLVVGMALNCRKPVVLPVYSARARTKPQPVRERPEKRRKHKLSALHLK